MPITLRDQNSSSQTDFGMERRNFNYTYPEGLNLRPGSLVHSKLRDMIWDKSQASQRTMESRYESWEKVDDSLTGYIKLDDVERNRKSNDSRKPVSVVIPVNYATREVLLTYLVSAFLNNPIIKIDGVGPEDVIGAALMEIVLQQQNSRAKAGLALHTSWMDSLTYGFGAVAVSWDVKTGFKTVLQDDGAIGAFGMLGRIFGRQAEQQRIREEAVLWEGNKLENIDPYNYLPDPDVPTHKVQDGSFVGWITRSNRMDLISDETNDPELFNARFLDRLQSGGGRSTLLVHTRSNRHRNRLKGIAENSEGEPVDVINMYIKLIPKEFGLGDKDVPEKWFFKLAGDEVILQAQPLGLDHDMFPVAIAVPQYDGYSVSPLSHMEMLQDMQVTVNWLFNAHMMNVSKAVNDVIIVDPSLINIKDLEDPQPGKIIRTRQRGWGKGVGDGIKQLNINDITRGNAADAAFLINTIRDTAGAADSISGIARNTSERVSAQEAMGVRSGALSRLEKMARIIGMQSLQDVGYMEASHVKQLLSEDTYAKIVGRHEQLLIEEYGENVIKHRYPVKPQDLLVDYDIDVGDGSIVSGEFIQPLIQLWQGLLSAPPEVQAEYESTRLFSHIMRIAGVRNLDDFKKSQQQQAQALAQAQFDVQPDAQVAQQAQAGNIVPIGQVQ